MKGVIKSLIWTTAGCAGLILIGVGVKTITDWAVTATKFQLNCLWGFMGFLVIWGVVYLTAFAPGNDDDWGNLP